MIAHCYGLLATPSPNLVSNVVVGERQVARMGTVVVRRRWRVR
jgi:hypothetical protein